MKRLIVIILITMLVAGSVGVILHFSQGNKKIGPMPVKNGEQQQQQNQSSEQGSQQIELSQLSDKYSHFVEGEISDGLLIDTTAADSAYLAAFLAQCPPGEEGCYVLWDDGYFIGVEEGALIIVAFPSAYVYAPQETNFEGVVFPAGWSFVPDVESFELGSTPSGLINVYFEDSLEVDFVDSSFALLNGTVFGAIVGTSEDDPEDPSDQIVDDPTESLTPIQQAMQTLVVDVSDSYCEFDVGLGEADVLAVLSQLTYDIPDGLMGGGYDRCTLDNDIDLYVLYNSSNSRYILCINNGYVVWFSSFEAENDDTHEMETISGGWVDQYLDGSHYNFSANQ